MFKASLRHFALLSALLVSPQLFAGGLYFGAKTGRMILDNTTTVLLNGIDTQPTNASLLVGYEIMGIVIGDLAVEGEISRTMSSGVSNGQDVDVESSAVYATLRTAGPFYFKVKTGFVNQNVIRGSVSASETGASSGAGIGIGIGVAQLELEWTVLKNDTSYASLGLQIDL